MQPDAIFAVVASAASSVILVRLIVKKINALLQAKEDAWTRLYTHKMIKEARIREARAHLTITVTNKATNDSVQLPPHYDPEAVSRFLEITA